MYRSGVCYPKCWFVCGRYELSDWTGIASANNATDTGGEYFYTVPREELV